MKNKIRRNYVFLTKWFSLSAFACGLQVWAENPFKSQIIITAREKDLNHAWPFLAWTALYLIIHFPHCLSEALTNRELELGRDQLKIVIQSPVNVLLKLFEMVVVVAQLVEWSLPTSEVCSSNPVSCNSYLLSALLRRRKLKKCLKIPKRKIPMFQFGKPQRYKQ